jgi:hypothetical protein
MKVLVVSKTKVGSKICVGALAADNTSLRLLSPDGNYQPSNTSLDVGDIWEMKYTAPRDPWPPPHVENVLVQEMRYLGKQENLAQHLLGRVAPWRGGPRRLYDGQLGFTSSSSGYIQAPDIPPVSTGYWISDVDLVFEDNYYWYRRGPAQCRMSYVGIASPAPVIPRSTLVRVSLARWWKQNDADESFPERCYLQLSGWYE